MAVYFGSRAQESAVSQKKKSSAVAIVDPATNVVVDLSQERHEESCSVRNWGKAAWSEISNVIPSSRPAGSGGSALRRLAGGESAFVRKVRGILNRLTPEKFDRLFEELLRQLITEVKCSSATMKDVLSTVTPIIFDKALSEPAFSATYAEMCSSLHSCLDKIDINSGEDPADPVIRTSKQRFQTLLLDLCQKEHMQENNSDTKRGKLRRLGNITLIAELFKRKLMPEQIVHIVVQRLLNMSPSSPKEEPSEENVETVCRLLETAGKRMDRPAAALYIDKYFAKLKKLSSSHSSPRVRFLIMNIIDMRGNGWPAKKSAPRRISVPVPKTAAPQRVASTGCLKSSADFYGEAAAKTVYITGIDPTIDSNGLDEFLESHGRVVKKSLCGNPKHATQFGFFEFESVAAADAVRDKDKTLLGGHRVQCSKPRLGRSKSGILQGTGKYVAAGPQVNVMLKSTEKDNVIGDTVKALAVGEVEKKAEQLLQMASEEWDVAKFAEMWGEVPEESKGAVLRRQVMTAVSLARMTDERRALINICKALEVSVVVSALREVFGEIVSTELWLDVPTLWRNTSSLVLECFNANILTATDVSSAVGPLACADEWDAFISAAAQYAAKTESDVDVAGLFTLVEGA